MMATKKSLGLFLLRICILVREYSDTQPDIFEDVPQSKLNNKLHGGFKSFSFETCGAC